MAGVCTLVSALCSLVCLPYMHGPQHAAAVVALRDPPRPAPALPNSRCLRPPAPQDLGVFDYDTGLCINGWGPVNTDFCDCVPTKTECTDCKE